MTQPKTIQQLFGMLPVNTFTGSKLPEAKVTNPDLAIGIELEIENLPLGLRAYRNIAHDFWNVEEDGSLRPRGESWEFISVPAHMKNAIPEMEALFKRLELTDDNYSDRCSVHVHTNVQDFTQDQFLNLCLVYPVFEEVIFHFINHHGKKEEQGYCRDTNLYCIPWSACRMNRKFALNILQGGEQYAVRNWQKYTALNLIPILDRGTVEWRHMHGTCDMGKLMIWMNIIGGIMAYAKRTSLEETQHVLQVMNDVSTYQQFFEEVLRDALPYSDEYRAMLREGVVNAKYSLVQYEAGKSKPKKAVKTNPLTQYLDDIADPFAATTGVNLGGAAGGGRIDTGMQPPLRWADFVAHTQPAPAPAPNHAEQLAAARRSMEEARAQLRRERDAITTGNRPRRPAGPR